MSSEYVIENPVLSESLLKKLTQHELMIHGLCTLFDLENERMAMLASFYELRDEIRKQQQPIVMNPEE